MENAGILYVFPIFHTEGWGQKIRCPAEDDLFRGSFVKTFYHAAGEKARATPHNLARRLSQMGGARQTVNRHSGMEPHPLPLPLGEVAERSEDGEGKLGKALSVTFGDSSPRGRAKGLYRYAPFTVLRPPKNQSVPVFAHNQNIMPLNRQKIRVII